MQASFTVNSKAVKTKQITSKYTRTHTDATSLFQNLKFKKIFILFKLHTNVSLRFPTLPPSPSVMKLCVCGGGGGGGGGRGGVGEVTGIPLSTAQSTHLSNEVGEGMGFLMNI